MHLAQSLGSPDNVSHTHLRYNYLSNVINVVKNITHFQVWLFVITGFLDEQITQRKTTLMWEISKYF